ncbi:hypothetical protein [Armatimonas sp.]|uniref:hypothetical protein n=1 Tax=Armatimonas sp. TaxID=1872638 RepID=UPI00286CDAB8|nr:hypothetical protein [Armatimonas sp.]
MAENSNSPRNESGGLNLKKFNSTSVTTTTDVITPKVSSQEKGRRAGLVLIVIVALGALGFMAFRSSGFNPFEKTGDGPGLARPEPNMPQ